MNCHSARSEESRVAVGADMTGFFAALRMTGGGVLRAPSSGAKRAAAIQMDRFVAALLAMTRELGPAVRWVAFAWAMLAVATLGARAETPEGYRISPREIREAVRATVDGQLAAFEQENFEAAYAFAARGIRRQFSAAVFAEMIRRGYPALVRHARRDVGIVRDNRDGRAFVDVTVFDARGRAARFRYQLVEERDGWRVEGVLPIRAETRGEV